MFEAGSNAPSFVADDVRLARRRSLNGLFVYHNLKDLLVSGAVVRLRLAAPDPGRATSFNLLEELSAQLIPVLPAGEGKGWDGPEHRGSVLTRVRFTELSVVAELANGRTFSIVASQARADPKFETLVFNGSVTITDTEGSELRGVEGAWSREWNGIYLPRGHSIKGRYQAGEAFFGLSGAGTLASRLPIPSIATHDEVEEMEAEFVAMVFGDLPLPLRAPTRQSATPRLERAASATEGPARVDRFVRKMPSSLLRRPLQEPDSPRFA
jgi:hypothetical protein